MELASHQNWNYNHSSFPTDLHQLFLRVIQTTQNLKSRTSTESTEPLSVFNIRVTRIQATCLYTKKMADFSGIFSASLLKYQNSLTLGVGSDKHITFSYPGATAEELVFYMRQMDLRPFTKIMIQIGGNDCAIATRRHIHIYIEIKVGYFFIVSWTFDQLNIRL